uniref:WW domain-containing protein n=2 Tax=Phytophthora ramorum TaxID=164328 RepID=H3GLS4_PHYRM
MTLSSPSLPSRGSSGSDHQSVAPKPRRARGSLDSTSSSTSGSASSSVLRVSKETENIGARVPLSKKRVTWRFVLAGSEQVHTLMLEHSRISAKKRLKLDGRRLFSSDQYATNWHYDFQVETAPFRVTICDVKTSVVDQGRLETLYDLTAEGVHWDQLAERFLPVAHRHHTASVWSSDMYVRRVEDTRGELLSDGDERPPGTLLTWTFAFGVNGSVHKLELRDLEKGEFVVVLDCRELKRVSYDDVCGDMWEFEYDLEDHHELDLVVTLVDEHKTYDFFIDGSAWTDISLTNFVLESGWYPVFSRSRSAVYFRHEGTGGTQWEKPIVNRDDVQTTRPLQEFEQVSPGSQGLDDLIHGVHAISTNKLEEVHEEPESEHEHAPQLVPTKQPLQPVQEVQEANLIDFSEVAVHVSPTQKHEESGYEGFDPFNPATHAGFVRKEQNGQHTQPPVDLLL